MAMSMGGGKGGIKADINVTPLVDIMLVLLIIMMLIAPLLQKGVNVRLPIAENTSEKPDTQEQTVVHVDAQKNLYVNNIQVAESDQGRGIRGDQPGVLESDHRQKQADTGRDREFQRMRDRIDDPLAHAKQTDHNEQAAGHEDSAERRLPAESQAEYHAVGEVRIQAHARGECDRIVRIQPHHGGTHCRGHAGSHDRP